MLICDGMPGEEVCADIEKVIEMLASLTDAIDDRVIGFVFFFQVL